MKVRHLDLLCAREITETSGICKEICIVMIRANILGLEQFEDQIMLKKLIKIGVNCRCFADLNK
jgi:hypothetical protein